MTPACLLWCRVPTISARLSVQSAGSQSGQRPSHNSPTCEHSHGKRRRAAEAVADLLSLLARSWGQETRSTVVLVAGLWILHGSVPCAYTSTPDLTWPAPYLRLYQCTLYTKEPEGFENCTSASGAAVPWITIVRLSSQPANSNSF